MAPAHRLAAAPYNLRTAAPPDRLIDQPRRFPTSRSVGGSISHGSIAFPRCPATALRVLSGKEGETDGGVHRATRCGRKKRYGGRVRPAWVYGGRVRPAWVKKVECFCINALQITIFRYFIVLPPYPLLKTYDRWVQREGYGGPELGEKSFNCLRFL
jgi:hypothetical protein